MSVPVVLAFAAGILSFLSPCIIPMISVYLTLITGTTLEEFTADQAGWRRSTILLNTLLFVFGFTLVFVLAGAATSTIGSVFAQGRRPLEVFGGIVVVVLGLSMAGLFQLGILERLHLPVSRLPGRPRGPAGSFAVGLFFSVACSHCIAPTLLAVMALAGETGSPRGGAVTMLIFSLGLGLPYMITAAAAGPVLERLGRWKAGIGWVRHASGVALAGFGILMVAGQFTRLVELSSRLLPFRVPLGM